MMFVSVDNIPELDSEFYPTASELSDPEEVVRLAMHIPQIGKGILRVGFAELNSKLST